MLGNAGTMHRSYLCEFVGYREAMKCQEQTKPRKSRAGGLHSITSELARRPAVRSTAGGGGVFRRETQESAVWECMEIGAGCSVSTEEGHGRRLCPRCP